MPGLKGKYMRLCKDLVHGDQGLKVEIQNKMFKSNYISLHRLE